MRSCIYLDLSNLPQENIYIRAFSQKSSLRTVRRPSRTIRFDSDPSAAVLSDNGRCPLAEVPAEQPLLNRQQLTVVEVSMSEGGSAGEALTRLFKSCSIIV